MAATAPLSGATILGYPRLGRRRELKRAIESFWAGRIDQPELRRVAKELRSQTRARLIELGLGSTGAGVPESFSYYDQVLDASRAVGLTPSRFDGLEGTALEQYFTLARGDDDHAPLEMTKYFDTNYHYTVPEIDEHSTFAAQPEELLEYHAEAQAEGIESRLVLVGPVTLLALSKAAEGAEEGFAPIQRLNDAVAAYASLLRRLAKAGVTWVQLDEPALVSDSLALPREEILEHVEAAYTALGSETSRPSILLTAPYGNTASALTRLAALPVEAIHADLSRGSLPKTESELREFATNLKGKQFVAGVIDGRNVWRTNLRDAFATVEGLKALGVDTVIGTSVSLQHVPHDVAEETKLDPRLKSWLAFADQKVEQSILLARGLADGADSIESALAEVDRVLEDRDRAPGVHVDEIRTRAASVTEADRTRGDAEERRAAQADLGIPNLATTTIGSFPQTAEIRQARARAASGDISTEAYESFLREEIERVIRLQEEIGLDVLVHGEPERNDMVQYFAEHLDGFAVTQHGWVQSYGTRATRPSILWGDVSRPAPITVKWSKYAQSLTDKPVKGMLTGPVTILAWSFVRDDQPLAETATQVALALRDEIDDLVKAGLSIVQVDEPALRELLPVDEERQAEYLEWSVGSFRLATAGAPPETQIHTHLCYSEFEEVIDAIDGLDADVTSIEAARSGMEVVAPIAQAGFKRGIGPGVYDIHSPRVPSDRELARLITLAAKHIPETQLWVNPDCGLKTRDYPETIESLKNLVSAVQAVRGA